MSEELSWYTLIYKEEQSWYWRDKGDNDNVPFVRIIVVWFHYSVLSCWDSVKINLGWCCSLGPIQPRSYNRYISTNQQTGVYVPIQKITEGGRRFFLANWQLSEAWKKVLTTDTNKAKGMAFPKNNWSIKQQKWKVAFVTIFIFPRTYSPLIVLVSNC